MKFCKIGSIAENFEIETGPDMPLRINTTAGKIGIKFFLAPRIPDEDFEDEEEDEDGEDENDI